MRSNRSRKLLRNKKPTWLNRVKRVLLKSRMHMTWKKKYWKGKSTTKEKRAKRLSMKSMNSMNEDVKNKLNLLKTRYNNLTKNFSALKK